MVQELGLKLHEASVLAKKQLPVVQGEGLVHLLLAEVVPLLLALSVQAPHEVVHDQALHGAIGEGIVGILTTNIPHPCPF